MTQKILFFLLILVAFVACKDDDENGFRRASGVSENLF